jgi:hypothetical protein
MRLLRICGVIHFAQFPQAAKVHFARKYEILTFAIAYDGDTV